MQTDLVIRARGGDREAFEILATWATPRLLAVARGMLREVDAAEDAVQRTLIGIWRGLPALRDPERFDAWTYRMVVNSCHAELRRRDPRVRGDDALLEVEHTVTDRVEQLVERDRLERALANLSPVHRSAVMLHVVLDLTQEETARVLGVPLGTVHSRVARAMDALRGALAADDTRMAAVLGPGVAAAGAEPHVAPLGPPASLGRFGGRRLVVAPDGFGDATTISAAVGAAQDGDVVLVRPGTYHESVTVTADIAIVGDGPAGSVLVDCRAVSQRAQVRGLGWSAMIHVEVPFGFRLVGTSALLADLAVRGPREAVAIVVDGGAPELHRLDLRLDGSWGGPGAAHHAIVMRGGATGMVVDCTIGANVLLADGASPVVADNRLTASLSVRDPGSAPVIRGNTLSPRGDAPWCLGIVRGAAPHVEDNTLSWSGGSAITVFSAESRPTIRANRISGSRIGIQTWDQSEPTIDHNRIDGNTVGVSVCWASPDLQGNEVVGNQATGLLVLGGPPPRLDGNRLRQNGSGLVRPVGMRLAGPRALRLATERM